MNDFNKKRYSELIKYLSSHKRVVIAYSGGIDSTLLTYAAIDALGAHAVTAVAFSSCLQRVDFAKTVTDIFVKQFGKEANLIVTEVDPLGWKEFQGNSKNRCYWCKKQMYGQLIAMAEGYGGAGSAPTLCDGTNYSDLACDRPGYKAIKEYNILTPLADVFLEKKDIRTIARHKKISNWDLSSDSCLATRIEKDTTITVLLLKTIEKAEDYLHKLGFKGCRVRHRGHVVELQVTSADQEKMGRILKTDTEVNLYFKTMGYEKIVLDPHSRKT